ncbi:glycosyltransferase [Dietzia sp. PP-33]|uniref:glycosyltransferase n=1 Tax=Dietzia sp. PP-33 TaxID=2957500 RepID=UPI0029A59101|nr:glycosyltransferase [Dietzia sp. PP-33]MDX2358778.1 glycosyltransferase [Dietzia sp. PP-33]
MSDSRRQQVLVVYPHLPHYRFGVFRELEDLTGYDMIFAADVDSGAKGIATIDFALLKTVDRLRNVRIGPALWQRGLIKVFRKRRPDVVIFFGDASYLSTWWLAILARLRGLDVVFWTIGWHAPERGLKRRVRLLFYRLAHTLMLYGETGAEIGRSMGYPAKRMHIVGNSSLSSLRSTTPPQAQIEAFSDSLPPAGADVIGAVIRLNDVKRLEMIIAAAAKLRSNGSDTVVLLVGEGPFRERLTSLSEDLEVPLYLPGAAYSDLELELAYKRLKVCVIPTVAGLTVLQSLSFGRPVVTHGDAYNQAPEFEAIEDGTNGGLYAYGDVDSLARTIASWQKKVTDDPEGTAERCRRSLDGYWTPQGQARRISKILDDTRGLSV